MYTTQIIFAPLSHWLFEIALKLLVRSFQVVALQRPFLDVINPTQSLVQPIIRLKCILLSYWSSRPSALTPLPVAVSSPATNSLARAQYLATAARRVVTAAHLPRTAGRAVKLASVTASRRPQSHLQQRQNPHRQK